MTTYNKDNLSSPLEIGTSFRLSKLLSHPITWFSVSSVILLLFFASTVESLVQKWQSSGTYAHGFIIVPVVMYLIWDKRHQLQQQVIRPSFSAIFPIALCIGLWQLGNLGYVQIVQQFSLVSLTPCLVLLHFGFSVFRVLLFPLAYLYFAIPFGHFMVSALQDITAFFVVQGLEWSGITVFVEGWQISTTRGQFEVAEACSGIRYLIAAIALGVLFAHYHYQSIWRKIAFTLLCILIPIVANGLRAYGIVVLAHMTHMKLAVGVDHLIYGWVFFGLMMVLLFWIGNKFKQVSLPEKSQVESSHLPKPSEYSSWILPVLPLTLFGLILTSQYIFQSNQPILQAKTLLIPTQFNNWNQQTLNSNEWQPKFIGSQQSLLQYKNEDYKIVDYFVAQYLTEQQGNELVSGLNTVFDSKIWNLAGSGFSQITVLGETFKCKEYELFNHYGRRLVWSWYEVNGVKTDNKILAKLLIMYHKVKGDLIPPKFVALSSEYQYYPERARKTLQSFLQASEMAVRDKKSDPDNA